MFWRIPSVILQLLLSHFRYIKKTFMSLFIILFVIYQRHIYVPISYEYERNIYDPISYVPKIHLYSYLLCIKDTFIIIFITQWRHTFVLGLKSSSKFFSDLSRTGRSIFSLIFFTLRHMSKTFSLSGVCSTFQSWWSMSQP